MYSPEKPSQPTADSGEVHQLESRKSALETYRAFYSIYNQETFLDTNGRMSSDILIGGRALHCDETGDASTHLIIRQYDDAHYFPGRRRFVNGRPEHIFTYDADGFVVVTTNGNTIDRWHVDNAHGIHSGRIDGVVNQYRPELENVHMQLSSADRNTRKELTFNRATGLGTMTLDSKRLGWILGEQDTARQQARIFETAPTIGHIATAS